MDTHIHAHAATLGVAVHVAELWGVVCEQKTGAGDKVIRRNSLTTLHPLPRSEETPESPMLERQRTVPHGFNVRHSISKAFAVCTMGLT